MNSEAIHNNVQKLVGEKYYNEGWEVYDSGAILDVQRDGKKVSCRIANEKGRFEKVTVNFKEHALRAQCSCLDKTAPYCKHAVALLFLLCEENPEVASFVDSLVNVPEEENTVEFTAQQLVSEPGVKSEVDGDSSFWKSFVQVNQYPGYFCFRIENDTLQFETRWSRVPLKLWLYYKNRTYSPGNIKVLLETGSAAAGMKLQDFTLQERQAMRFIIKETDVVDGTCNLHACQLAELLHLISGSSRICGPEGRINIHSQPLELVFVLQESSADGYVVQPSLILPGHGKLEKNELSAVAGWGGCWFGSGPDLWWLPGVNESGCVRNLIHGTGMKLSEEEFEGLQKACREGALPGRVELEDKKRNLELQKGEMVPCVTLDWREKGVWAELAFDYDSKRVHPGDSEILRQGDTLVARDFTAEHTAEDALRKLGFKAVDHSRGHYSLQHLREVWDFALGQMEKQLGNWRLYWSSGFAERKQHCGWLTVEVNTVYEDEMCFELACQGYGPNNGVVEWDATVDAHRNGEEYVYTQKGTVLRISAEVRRMLEYFNAYASSKENGHYRFGKYAAFPIFQVIRNFCDGNEGEWIQTCKRFLEADNRQFLDKVPGVNGTLRDYQREGVAWFNKLKACKFHGVLADEMGLGKTVQALAAILEHKLNEENPNPSLVVCPTSLIENWYSEATRFTPQLNSVAIYGSNRDQYINALDQYDLCITSYALLRRDKHKYSPYTLDYLVLDEAQHIKNPGTSNAKACKELQSRFRAILTGTPVENNTREVWSLFDFLCPGMLGNQQYFRRKYDSGTEFDESKQGPVELAKQIRPFILRRTKDEVFEELPEKMEHTVYCELSDEQRDIYNHILSEGRSYVETARKASDSFQNCRFELLALLLRMRQVCCHPALLPEEFLPGDGKNDKVTSGKMELFKEKLQECLDDNHRVLVFSQFTGMLKQMIPALRDLQIPYEYLDGSTKNRQAKVDRFNEDSSIPVFLISLKAGGLGLNLTGADTVVHYDQWWNPMVEDQATDRTHRIGQDKVVTSLRFVTKDTIEEKIFHLQKQKRELFDKLIGTAPEKLDALSDEDLAFLFSTNV